MRLTDAPPLDVRPLLAKERDALVALLGEVDAEDWSRSTVCPGWAVKDVALHVIGDDLSILSSSRDGDPSGLLPPRADRATFIAALNAKNESWVAAARGLSPRIVCALLRWTGTELSRHYEGVDLRGEARVLWASDRLVPMWFEVVRALTEHWLHQQQIRDAVGRAGLTDPAYLEPILASLIWAVPHHYRSVQAPAGTEVAIDVSGAGGAEWTLTRRLDGWELDAKQSSLPSARIELSSDALWRLLSGALPSDARVSELGDASLTAPFLSARAFLV